MVRDYQPEEKLDQSVKLIRVTSGFTSLTNLATFEDYDLIKFVSEMVSVVKVQGDHKTFPRINNDQIASEIIIFL